MATASLLLSSGSPATAAERPGTVTRVSVSTSGEPANAPSISYGVSAHGRYAVFISAASNLVPGDTNEGTDVFVRDRLRGTTERVSVGTGGRQANDDSFHPVISADGRFVAYDSAASNLVSRDTNATYDVFVRDRMRGTTVRVSVGPGGRQGNSSSGAPSLSAGRYVAFDSSASNLVAGDSNGGGDVFVHDLHKGVTHRVSLATGRRQGDGGSFLPAISRDGRYVAFGSGASNLVRGDTNNAIDFFVRDRVAGTTERVSVSSRGVQGNADSHGVPSISATDRYVAFSSFASNLTPGGSRDTSDVFVRDRRTKRTELVSIRTGGDTRDPSISADGRYVAYVGFPPGAPPTSLFPDIFVRDRSRRFTQQLTTGGAENLPPHMSADGSHVAFSRRTGGDQDTIEAVVWDAAGDRSVR